MAFNGFDELPSGATAKAEPFQLHVPETELAAFQTLLQLSPVGPDTWENRASARDGRGTHLGVTRAWLAAAKAAWLADFDWRAHEARINSFPQFTMPIPAGDEPQQPPLRIHFAALFAANPAAPAVVFLHGWPGCFLEFLPVLALLRARHTPATLPFHAVVPSLPGYGPSAGPPAGRDFAPADAARVLNRLMVALGFGGGYIAQGGDVGAVLACAMSTAHDECRAFHVNFLAPEPGFDTSNLDGVEARELLQLERIRQFRETGMAYAWEHATRPATIGLVLAASPLALLAWIGEKYLEWSDADGIPLDTILSVASLYWFTSSMPRCIWPYRELLAGGLGTASKTKPMGPSAFNLGTASMTKPMGYSAFKDITMLPKAWAEKCYPNLQFRKDHEKGGHFAALEEPEAFLGDIEEFVAKVVVLLS